uniref:Uncharacterized protein n=1 Tax=uncultured bacterium W5-77b TaxID=1131000 RepID=H9BWG8_9BACT|nr:hypothetical protein [uncultured bacterium W5-77b]
MVSSRIVVLEEKFHDKITSLIHKTLKSNEISSPELKQKIWEYEHDDDFKYGHKAGFLIGLIIGDYMKTYERFPSPDELIEIRKIIESHLDEIKDSILDHFFFYKE